MFGFRSRWLITGAVIGAGAAALALGAGGVLAGEAETQAGQPVRPGELETVRVEPVAAAAALAGSARIDAPRPSAKAREPRLRYLESDPRDLAAGPTGFRVGSCPKRSRAINGYYFVEGTQAGFGLDAQGDSPVKGLKQWAFYLNGGITGVEGVTFGLICLQNVE